MIIELNGATNFLSTQSLGFVGVIYLNLGEMLTDFLSDVVAALPALIAAIVVLVIGYIVGKFVGRAVNKIIEKIVEGKIGKFYQDACLLNQPFIKNDKLTVQNYLEETGKKLEMSITVKQFKRYAIGR